MKPDTVEKIAAEASARGLSAAEYLKSRLPQSNEVDLVVRGISASRAAGLRTRLRTFAEDWDRSEADVYSEDPPL